MGWDGGVAATWGALRVPLWCTVLYSTVGRTGSGTRAGAGAECARVREREKACAVGCMCGASNGPRGCDVRTLGTVPYQRYCTLRHEVAKRSAGAAAAGSWEGRRRNCAAVPCRTIGPLRGRAVGSVQYSRHTWSAAHAAVPCRAGPHRAVRYAGRAAGEESDAFPSRLDSTGPDSRHSTVLSTVARSQARGARGTLLYYCIILVRERWCSTAQLRRTYVLSCSARHGTAQHSTVQYRMCDASGLCETPVSAARLLPARPRAPRNGARPGHRWRTERNGTEHRAVGAVPHRYYGTMHSTGCSTVSKGTLRVLHRMRARASTVHGLLYWSVPRGAAQRYNGTAVQRYSGTVPLVQYQSLRLR